MDPPASEDPPVEPKVVEALPPGGSDQGAPPPEQYDPLRRYLWEISRYSLLTPEEEKELAVRYHQTGDPEAAARLVTSNLRLVVKIAMDFRRYWMRNLLDLIQEGNVGLMHAVKKFNPYKDVKLSYYSSFWIKAYILKFIMDNWKLVKVGTTQAQRKLFYNLRKEKEKLIAQGFEPGPQLLAHRLGVKESEVTEMEQRLGSWEVSLDAPLKDDSADTRQAFLPSEERAVDDVLADNQVRQVFRDELRKFRQTLDGKKRDIFDRRLMSEKPVTLRELSEAHGISRERVRQIEAQLIKNVRHHMIESIPGFEENYADLLANL
ncbi:MAG: RNA polymerase factor sigma-32 [Proteobacteria bacterium]|nr:RNA polymerase factor sigma-32 [Pseudomonadota bacterium]MBU1740111.1 RNA polymerase factor sigma-32 [Pseudomonadota bacterium]